jgi:NitT/TauT family transport system substrate-binding protein
MKTTMGIAAALLAFTALTAPSLAADKVVVGYSMATTALPYFVAIDQGYFEEADLEIEPVVQEFGAMNQATLISNQLDVATVLLAVEVATADIVAPGSMTFISLNAQNASHRMESFIVRKGYEATTLADLKGAKILSAPGVGNEYIARAALEKAGLKEGDFTLDQLSFDQHMTVLQTGQYDAAFTLEPLGTIIEQQGIGTVLQAGVIADTVLGDPEAAAYMGGAVVSAGFLDRPEVLDRFVDAWGKAIDFIASNPDEARQSLVKHEVVTADMVNIPLVMFTKSRDIDATAIGNLQKYIDFGVEIGTVPSAIDIAPYVYVRTGE